jgi:hypothetical protein
VIFDGFWGGTDGFRTMGCVLWIEGSIPELFWAFIRGNLKGKLKPAIKHTKQLIQLFPNADAF